MEGMIHKEETMPLRETIGFSNQRNIDVSDNSELKFFIVWY